MLESPWRAIITGGLFAVILVSGYLLSRAGKPYGALLLSVHKLIALGAVVFLVLTLLKLNRVEALGATAFAAALVAGVLFLILIVTGGIISAAKTAPGFVTILHRIAPYFAVIAAAATLFLLRGRP
jgi:hypothetical protein